MLTPPEIAAGFPLSRGPQHRRLIPSGLEPRAALAQSIVAALSRPPCVVSFSGGRDSSLVLALAVDSARREGFPLPIPVTARPAGDADPEEAEWQEIVVRNLGLEDWERVEMGEELDCVGPEAQRVLLRHGILWPANVYFHLPQLQRAAGGSVLTGVGGDEVFSSSGWARVRAVLGGRARPEPRDALRLAAALAPVAVRTRVQIARSDVELGWLRPAAQRAVVAAVAGEAAAEPVRWRQRFDWLLGLSHLEVGTRSLDALAGDFDVEMRHPFLDAAFVGTLASLPRRRRFTDRTDALRTLFGDLLPKGLAGTARGSIPRSSTSRRFAAAGRSTALSARTRCSSRSG